MTVELKRIYIKDLPHDLNLQDVQHKFSEYGTVGSVEIKQRKNVGTNQTPQFAYVQLEIEKEHLENCLHEISNTKWKGNWVSVEVAKESFMERLKQEREGLTNGAPKASTVPKIENSQREIFLNIKNTRKSDTYSNAQNYKNCEGQIENDLNSSRVESIVTPRKRLKIESVAKPISEDSPTKLAIPKLGVKETAADLKRLQSMTQMIKEYHKHKSYIKNALANIDFRPKNKIIFSDEAEASTPPSKKRKSKGNEENGTGNRLELFGDDDENDYADEEFNFEVKDHFQGKKGQELMELQSKFKNDKRFTLDRRFLDNPENEVSVEQEEMSFTEEKDKQYEILNEVLGRNVTNQVKKKKSEWNNTMFRFDPTQREHEKYEIIEQVKTKNAPKERDDSVNESLTITEAPKPEVSKDTFYKVAEDLKNTLHVDNEFSLANMFSKSIQNEEQSCKLENTTKELGKPLREEPNPFSYDSSNEDEEINKNTVEEERSPSRKLIERSGPARLWTESFFFKDDDYRLQEGLDFIQRLQVDDQEDFLKLRRSLKEIVRAKVRNNQRNNRPFKTKLGGKKRLRVKRAMKR